MQMHIGAAWRRPRVAVAAVAALGVAGCGSSSDDSGSTAATASSSTPSAAAAALGSPDAAAGAPVTIGMITDGKGQVTDQSSELHAAQAAVDYLNAYRGGLDGHEIDLKVCQTKQTPAGGTACANQMLAAKVPAVLVGSSAVGGVVASRVAKGGTVVFNDQAIDPQLFALPNTYMLTNGITSLFGVPAQSDKEAGIKKAAYVVNDLPAATEGVNSIGKAYFGAAGVDLDVIAVPLGTPDVTPQIQAAIAKGVKAIHVIAESNLCTAVFKAAQTLNFQGPITGITQCFPGHPGDGLPKGAEGLAISATGASFPPQQADPETEKDFALFDAVMDKYAKGQNKAALAPIGYRVVMGFAAAMAGNKGGPITTGTINATLKAMPKIHMPLGAGQTFQCDGKQYALGPAFCGASGVIASLDKSGDVTKYQTLDVTLELPTTG
jgi:branched-chain amino acid transport system substrate-binding protein